MSGVCHWLEAGLAINLEWFGVEVAIVIASDIYNFVLVDGENIQYLWFECLLVGIFWVGEHESMIIELYENVLKLCSMVPFPKLFPRLHI